ncbi:50S ribosomal protein L5 [Candidatus Bathyarchaeota archaeon]|nr:50S ribosomal protein L5 [Candidatus Bathyarchaeota archaeon]
MSQETVTSTTNVMQQPRIEKVVINLCTGQAGEPLQKAKAVLESITGRKACQRKAKTTVRDWGLREGEPIAVVVTLRKGDAISFLKRAFYAVGNRLKKSSFDSKGNFAFGIREHIELPGVRYDPSVGIFGMDVCITMGKPGYRVKRRRKLKNEVGRAQRITPEESVNYVKELFGIDIVD